MTSSELETSTEPPFWPKLASPVCLLPQIYESRINYSTSAMLNRHPRASVHRNAAIFECVWVCDHILFRQKFNNDISNGSRVVIQTSTPTHPATNGHWKHTTSQRNAVRRWQRNLPKRHATPPADRRPVSGVHSRPAVPLASAHRPCSINRANRVILPSDLTAKFR